MSHNNSTREVRPWARVVAWLGLAGMCGLLTLHGGADSASVSSATSRVLEDRSSQFGPIDRGLDDPPVTSTSSSRAVLRAAAAVVAAAASPTGPETIGQFLPAVPWPVIPIHMTLLSDGRVMAYGSTEQGLQSGQFNYAVWDPALGTDSDAHLLLPNTTGTDIFCSGQIVLPRTGEVILTGGDNTINGVRNYSVPDVTFFDFLTNTLRKSAQSMAQPRWYPSVTTLLDGTVLVLGGRDAPVETAAIATPELYDPASGWRSLTGATSNDAYGIGNWYYPRAWTAPDGRVFVVAITGNTFVLDPTGNGTIVQQPLTVPAAGWWHPAVMYAPGHILSVRNAGQVSLIDLTGSTPTAAATGSLSQERIWSNATVLADGKVLVSGGSAVENQAVDVAYHTELWDPATGVWTRGASATRMRLYHSTAMLLPDGRVLTAGGGAPGPVTNLNAEIYEPPYLFKPDGSGDYATRPAIQSAPAQAAWGDAISVQMQDSTTVSRVAFIRTGSVTHSFDFDQRYMTLAFAQSGSTLTVQMPADVQTAPPGNYLLFAFDDAGVPSVAKIIRIAAATDAFPNSITVSAKATLAAGVGAMMDVRVDGNLIASTEVRSTSYQNYSFPLPFVAQAGAKVEVVYTNDDTIGSEDRNLYVQSVTINRSTMLPTDAGVVFDRGGGSAAFDNLDVVSGTTDLTTNGALRFAAPGAVSSLVSVRVRADIAENIGPIMQIRVNGTLVASSEIRDVDYTDRVYKVPVAITPGSKVDVVYINDGSATGDRNLYVQSLTVNGGTVMNPTDAGVTLDIGSGDAAFDGQNVIPGQSAIYWNAALRFVVPSAANPQITVRAKGSLAGGVGPLMQLYVDGAQVGPAVEVKNSSYANFVFTLPTAVNPGAKVDVVFNNDALIGTEDRNLYVESITVNGTTLLPTDPGVTVDIGSGAAAFDGIQVIPGQTDILWNAALRFVAPDSNAPKLTVRAMGSLAGGVGPLMQVLIDGSAIGSYEVKATSFTDFVFALPGPVNPGAHIDVVYSNDAVINGQDRNLYVESIVVNGMTILATDPGVTVDIGSGAAAFDGVNVIPGQSALLWNAALRFIAPNTAAPKLTLRAHASLAAGVGAVTQVWVNGVNIGSVEVKSTSDADYVFSLPSAVTSGSKIDVVFTNDAVIGSEDRNLYVTSVTVNGVTLLPTDAGVTVDIGSGDAAFDGVNVIPGQTDLLWNAALRMTVP